MVSPGVVVASVLSVLLILFGVLFFLQTKDPMVLVFAVQLSIPMWVVVFVLHVLRRGIPVRIVADERQKP